MANISKHGTAYGVLKCSDLRPMPALIARFKEALENIRLAHDETGIPPETGFSVFDIRSGISFTLQADGSDALVENIRALESKGANLMVRSELPGASNAVAARDLGDAINMLYGGTELFDAENEGRANPVMDIFFKNGIGKWESQLSAGLSEEGRA